MKKTILKKAVSFAVVAGMVGSMVAIPAMVPSYAQNDANQKNMLIDGDFEAGGQAWSEGRQKSIAEGISYGDGQKSGKLPENNGNSYIGQIVKVDQNTEYTVSAYIKTGSDDAKVNFTIRAGSEAQLKGNGGTVLGDYGHGGASWQKAEHKFNTGENEYVLIELVKWVTDSNALAYKNAAYIDNVVLTGEEKEPEVYSEIWRDDFNEEQLDTKDWGYELGCIRGVEQQHYVNSKDNVFMRNGNLVLKATDRAKEDQYKNPRGNRQVIYNSGSVRTHGKREFLYGKIEMRAKLPKGRGAFPAFWTLGADFTLDGKVNGKQGYGWSRCGEIDIMELLGGYEGEERNRQVWGTPHFYDAKLGDQWDQDTTGSGGRAYTNATDFNDDYHVFGIVWNPDKIEWYVDGKIYNTLDFNKYPSAKKCFNRPQYIQLNLAMGGNWPGDAATNLAGTEFVIDYVSYQQTEAQKAAAQAYCDEAPQLTGVKNITMVEGQTPDLLAGVTSNRNSFVDFSVENEHMFKVNGGNTSVDLVCSGKDDVAALAKLPTGKYNIHYTAIPSDIQYDGNRPNRDTNYKFTRKSAILTIKERSIEDDLTAAGLTLEGYAGDTLETVTLPEGWSFVDASQILKAGNNEVKVIYDITGKESTVNITVYKSVTQDELTNKVNEAQMLLVQTDVYTKESLANLQIAVDEAKQLLNTRATGTFAKYTKAYDKIEKAIAALKKIEKPAQSGSGSHIEVKPATTENGSQLEVKPGQTSAASKQNNVKTGDQTNLTGYAAMFILALGAICFLRKKRT